MAKGFFSSERTPAGDFLAMAVRPTESARPKPRRVWDFGCAQPPKFGAAHRSSPTFQTSDGPGFRDSVLAKAAGPMESACFDKLTVG